MRFIGPFRRAKLKIGLRSVGDNNADVRDVRAGRHEASLAGTISFHIVLSAQINLVYYQFLPTNVADIETNRLALLYY